MTKWMLAFSVGVIILHCSGIVLPWNVEVLLLALISCLFALVICPARYFIIAAFFALGYVYVSQSVQDHQSNWLPDRYVGQSLTLEGFACSLPKRKAQYFTIEFCGKVLGDDKTTGDQERKFQLSGSPEYLQSLRQGRWIITGVFKPPRASINPVGMSYEKYLFSHRVVGRLWLKKIVAAPEKISNWGWFDGLTRLVNQHRWDLDERLLQAIQSLDLSHPGIVRALIIGERDQISAEDNLILQESGLQHLMAISGLHVGILFWCLLNILPKRKSSVCLVVLIGFAYICLVGFSASAQRAWVMGVLALCVLRGGWILSKTSIFMVAMTCVLLIDPFAPMQLGFWYSFCAVLLILIAAHYGWLSEQKPLKTLLVMQGLFLVFGAIMNAIFALPHGLSMWGANVLAVPLVSLVVLPLAMVASVLTFLVEPSLGVAGYLFQAADHVLSFILQFSQSLLSMGRPIKTLDHLSLLTALAGSLLALMVCRQISVMRVLLMTTLVTYLLIPVNQAFEQRERSPAARMILFDSGQGLSLLFEHHRQVWVYDLGPAFEHYSVAERVVMPYLRAKGLEGHLHGLVLSHGDADHVGRADWFIAKTRPNELISGEPNRVGLGFDLCQPGQVYRLGDARLSVLYAAAAGVRDVRASGINSNDQSCVMRFSFQGFSVVLMGDLEGKAELDFLRTYPGSLDADILILGHHGAPRASQYALLKRVKPDVAVSSAGYANRFNHPHPNVRKRLSALGIHLMNTAESGAITFEFAGDQLEVKEERARSDAYWMWPLTTK